MASDMLPQSHHGTWSGPNRLWMEDPQAPERSDGSLDVSATEIGYTWTFRNEPQNGRIRLLGPAAAVHASWTDTFHASDGMHLYGFMREGFLQLVGTYGAGDDVEWGWTIEVDFRDPEHLTLRMFNVPPGHDPMIAVDLHGQRP